MITNYTILGERCSGTNYLGQLMTKNFKIKTTWKFGWKHFYGHHNYKKSNNTLFIGIVRDPVSWLDSFYKIPHHLPKYMHNNIDNFLTKEIHSYRNGKNNTEILGDHNMHTKQPYKNIFELRKIKAEFLLDHMPKLVKNFILIRYEDLRDNPKMILSTMKNKFGLKNNNFVGISYYKGNIDLKFAPKPLKLNDKTIQFIKQNLDKKVERRLGYNV